MGFLQNAGNKLEFHNLKLYFDLFYILKVINAESPIVFFFGTYSSFHTTYEGEVQ